MPKNNDIKTILVIGSGPIMIGQACEFDYSGTQALKALREEGYRIILVNSNPATIMTDQDLADATYIEPITPEYLELIIAKERPCAIIPTLGGQTSLNCALALYKSGALERYSVKLIGASYEAIILAEDRTLFREKMLEIGLDMAKSKSIFTKKDALGAIQELGLPLIIRSSFTLGGAGAKIAYTEAEVMNSYEQAMEISPLQELIFDEALIGWKEFELEVIRDKNDNCIVICGVENFDPLGIHTGDSITVAPIQTLTDKEYQKMRDAAFKVLRAVGVDTGGSNVQFAVNPKTGRMVVIEMNPRVSRSSALVSKATGFPIAKIAAKLAIGYALDELRNEITNGLLPASFEPTIDYVVVKIPRFHDEKFNAQQSPRGAQMRSVGEVMSIGSTFKEALQNALCSLEIDSFGFDLIQTNDNDMLRSILKNHPSMHIYAIAEAFRRGFSIDEAHNLSYVDPWFLAQIADIIKMEDKITIAQSNGLTKYQLLSLKKNGFSDQRIATLLNINEKTIRNKRQELEVLPVYKHVDSCAGEFSTSTSYMYSTYQEHCENKISANKKIIIIGSGPNRIGQGIEFDYICVKAIQAFKRNGFETIMLNCNPETVSTDYDCADKLYFIPLTYEKVMDVITKENPSAVALQFGGQTPINLLASLAEAGVKLIGINAEVIYLTEDREKFRQFLQLIDLKQPENIVVSSINELAYKIRNLNFPLIIRPSFVLGGKGMEVINNITLLEQKIAAALQENSSPILIEEFLEGAIEVDVDAISDGEDVFIPLILEHIEAVGVHSGDSACVTPGYLLTKAITNVIHQQTKTIAKALKIKGLFNIQFAIKNDNIYIIEVNPRASRTTPFICKATGLSLIDIAVNAMLGLSLKSQKCLSSVQLPYYCIKEAVLPFNKFILSEASLGPEMKSTGEVMGIGSNIYEAYFKAQVGSGHKYSLDNFTILLSGVDDDSVMMEIIKAANYKTQTNLDLKNLPQFIISLDKRYLSFAIKHSIPYTSTSEAAQLLLESIKHRLNNHNVDSIMSLQSLYQKVKHPSKTSHFITGMDLTYSEIRAILDMAKLLKQSPEKYSNLLAGKSLAMFFDKPSFRTRFSFALAIQSLGGIYIESIGSTRKTEEPRDLIKVLNGYVDFVMLRTHEESIFEEMVQYSTVPIINGLSELHHPCQILADLLALEENFGYLDGLTLTYIGDGNNILHSLMLLCPQFGIKIKYCCPPANQPKQEILLLSNQAMFKSFSSPKEAAYQAHAIYTDVWTSMGFEGKIQENNFSHLQVNEKLMSHAKLEAVFMHCMPMERGKEVSYVLPDSPSSIIFEQSENRLHVQKALLLFLGNIRINLV